ncbi:MAG: MBL fold metallo-hydrolase [Candidatus Thorarchaeota archaeon]|jgi:L-ascorbate metabolism protein UlaG (beta-lactamase superfamily)
MSFLKNKMAMGAIIVAIIGIGSVGVLLAMNINTEPPPDDNIEVTLLNNAGVMFEANGERLYIDPYNLPDNQTELPADAILVTHPHGDHYHFAAIEKIATENTVFVFPENMSTEINRHDGTGVNPGDTLVIGSFTVTAFWMYTLPPPGTDYEASHAIESNWTSYIVEVNGMTFFHAGDSKNIPEYEELTGTIDVAFLPLGPGCQTMCDDEVVDALAVIEPDVFIPIHYGDGTEDSFETAYSTQVENLNIELIILAYFEGTSFTIES